jgi:hypothetical protein
MDITTGLFALGGVALTGLLTEVRAWRERRVQRDADLHLIRRETYSKALHDVEQVGSTVARWAEAPPDAVPGLTAQFWEVMSAAYDSLNKVRLLGTDHRPAEAMAAMLQIYRRQVTSGERETPTAGEARHTMVAAFRRDLGLG